MARVLIIDDSATVARALCTALEHDGHEVEAHAEFAQLGMVLDTFKPDVLVLDLLMPGFSGLQFARFVQRVSNDPPPIILHSGSDPEMMRIAAREIRPFEIVPKGASERDLRRAVARAVAERRRSAVDSLRRSREDTPTALGAALSRRTPA